jgi:rhamnosyltransferase
MNANEPKKENICSIIITYHPDADFTGRAIKTARQVGKVVIVDNHSNDQEVAMLRRASSRLNAHLILNPDNFGVATALNQGICWAREQGCVWALTFDQDTVPSDKIVDDLIAVYQDCPFRENIGMIGTNYQDPNNGYVHRQISPSHNAQQALWEEKKTLITSGCLLSISAFERVGPFRDEFFIDQVDHEYCLRLRKYGYRILLSLNLGMLHSVGVRKSHKFFWHTMETLNHNPVRRYYIMRNRMILARESLGKVRGTIRVLKKSRKDLIRVLLFESQKLNKAYAMALGIYHGISGKAGKLSPNGFFRKNMFSQSLEYKISHAHGTGGRKEPFAKEGMKVKES